MTINLRPMAATPLEVDDKTYRDLVARKGSGWSNCDDELEWLAKLHYLRSGFREGKLEPAQFEEREARLVVGWLRKLT